MRHLEYQQLQPRRLGHLPACSEGRIADSAAPAASAVSAAVADASAVADAAAVAGATTTPSPTVHVPDWAASVQRQLPSADCFVGVPIWPLFEHASLRVFRTFDWVFLRG